MRLRIFPNKGEAAKVSQIYYWFGFCLPDLFPVGTRYFKTPSHSWESSSNRSQRSEILRQTLCVGLRFGSVWALCRNEGLHSVGAAVVMHSRIARWRVSKFNHIRWPDRIALLRGPMSKSTSTSARLKGLGLRPPRRPQAFTSFKFHRKLLTNSVFDPFL